MGGSATRGGSREREGEGQTLEEGISDLARVIVGVKNRKLSEREEEESREEAVVAKLVKKEMNWVLLSSNSGKGKYDETTN